MMYDAMGGWWGDVVEISTTNIDSSGPFLPLFLNFKR